jgi:hypothetical protein
MYDMGNVTPLFTVGSQARMLESWRQVERLVETRWRDFEAADGATRRFAFACYVAALDAEEAAASELAIVSDDIAA